MAKEKLIKETRRFTLKNLKNAQANKRADTPCAVISKINKLFKTKVGVL